MMHPDIATWIMEFMVRDQTVNDRTINSLLKVLPLPTDSYSLKKSLLLRKIVSQTQRHGICEDILDLLEFTEELDHVEGFQATASMKHAYCQVAAECTLRAMGDAEEYIKVVKKVWRGRVLHMEDCKLISEDLYWWMFDFEKALWDKSYYESSMIMEKEIDAVGAVKTYLSEAWEGLGPTVLDMATFLDIVANDSVSKEMFGFEVCLEESRAKGMQNGDVVGKGLVECVTVDDDVTSETLGLADDGMPCQHPAINDGNNVTQIGLEMPRTIRKCLRGSINGTSRGAKTFDTKQVENNELSKSNDCLISSAIDKVQVAPKASSLKLHDIETDPLPEALQLAGDATSTTNRYKRSLEVLEDEADSKRTCTSHENNVPIINLTTQITSASTWGDSMGSLRDTCRRSRMKLSSRNIRFISPSNKHEMRNRSGRRIRKMWSIDEEEILRVVVKKYGEGCWKAILKDCRNMFNDRTEVDLKDKWRNMTRASHST